MAKKRMIDAAKEAGVPVKELWEVLRKQGLEIKSHFAAVPEEDLRRALETMKKPVPAEPASKPKAGGIVPSPDRSQGSAVPSTTKTPAAPPTPAQGAVKPPSRSSKGAGPAHVKSVPTAKPHVPPPQPPPPPAAAVIPAPPVPEPAAVTPVPEETPPAAPAAVPVPPVIKGKIKISESVTVSDLAHKLNVGPVELVKKLLQIKIMAAVNQRIDPKIATLLAEEYGYQVELIPLYGEDMLLEVQADQKKSAPVPRAPVVTIMGHVDHGKTSLLDAIRQTNVTEQEAGGITQHIGAYKVSLPGKGDVVFLDTPGHQAFTAMRARGASVTDVVVIVVAADDGVMPQTVEAIHHAQAAGIPILVAINKVDKEGANTQRVRQQLTEHQLLPEEWGGKTIMIEVSAKKKMNLEKLLEMLLLEAEMLELRGDPSQSASGAVIEARLDKGRGAVATILIQEGTLRVGDSFIAGTVYGKVRALLDDKGKRITAAGPSTPVEVLGISGVPQAGDRFQVVTDEKMVRHIAIRRQELAREHELSLSQRVNLQDLFDQIQKGSIKELKIILKADVTGSAEAVTHSLESLSNEKVKLRVIHNGVGNVTESDVMLAATSNAVIMGFNVQPDTKAAELSAQEKVDIRCYRIIYEVVNDVKAAMEGLLEPKLKEVSLGRADVRRVFKISREGSVAGCYVQSGTILRSGQCRVIRNGAVMFEGKLSSLKRFKDDVSEVATGFECGIGIDGFGDLQIGDVFESFTMESVAQKL